jgi:hypothetical protein
MWQVWEWDGRYIQGNLVSKHTSRSAAVSKAKKHFGKNIKLLDSVKNKVNVIYIDELNSNPIGIILEKKKNKN